MTLVSLFKKSKPATPYANLQPATVRHGQVEGPVLDLARAYLVRRPGEPQVQDCKQAIGWDRLDEAGRWHAQHWLLGLVARLGTAQHANDAAKFVRADFPVLAETEQLHRSRESQAQSVPRLHVELACERQQVEKLQEKVRGLEEAQRRDARDRDVLVDEREDARRHSAVYFDRLSEVMELMEQTRPVLALAPNNLRQGRVGRVGASVRHSLPPNFSNWAEVQAVAEEGGYAESAHPAAETGAAPADAHRGQPTD